MGDYYNLLTINLEIYKYNIAINVGNNFLRIKRLNLFFHKIIKLGKHAILKNAMVNY